METIKNELHIQIGRNKPAASQIRDEILRLIKAGSLQPGDQLPTVRLLAAWFGVHFNTIARAYRDLDDAGAVSIQQGRGTFVLALPAKREDTGEAPAEGEAEKPAIETWANTMLSQAAELGFSPSAVANEVQKLAWAERDTRRKLRTNRKGSPGRRAPEGRLRKRPVDQPSVRKRRKFRSGD